MTTLADVRRVIQSLWPEDRAEGWDAVGLAVGDPEQPVQRILLAVDCVRETVAEAKQLGADLLFTHHPLMLRGVTSVAADTGKGSLVHELIRSGIALHSAHTNADVVERGTSGEIARRLGLTDLTPIEPSKDDPEVGLGRVGTLPEPLTLEELAGAVAKMLPATATGVRAAGEPERSISTVAICGGAGDSFLEHPAVLAADAYITADLRHHPASEARERHALGRGPALIDTSHWASEWLWLPAAAEQLAEALAAVTLTVSELRTDPWDFAITQ